MVKRGREFEGWIEIPRWIRDSKKPNTKQLQKANVTTHLRLWNENISSVPAWLGQLTHLKSINFEKLGEIVALPDVFDSMCVLESFAISSCAIQSLPPSVGRLPNLKTLTIMFCNNLETLPESLGGLQSLTTLQISYCKVRALPESIGSLRMLETLTMTNCLRLVTLPESIGDLPSLVAIDLSGAGVSFLPTSIERIASLKYLYLGNCKSLKNIPRMPALQNVHLPIHLISVLIPTFQNVSNLQHVAFD